MHNIIHGNSLEVLKTLPDESVQCAITSPPYFSMKDYENENQIGLEKTSKEFIGKLVDVFQEVKRVLKDDGTLWLNLGDCFSGSGGYSPNSPSNLAGSLQSGARGNLAKSRPAIEYPAKNLMGIPWMTAFALRDAGWILRCDCIWQKNNCSPEKVFDRPTRIHEYVFLFSKSKIYYYDYEAVMEDAVTGGKRNRRSVWEINNQRVKGAHTAVFPEKLVEICLLASSKPEDTVIDPFCGSGTTGVVAKKLGRHFIGIDLNEEYCELATNRIAHNG